MFLTNDVLVVLAHEVSRLPAKGFWIVEIIKSGEHRGGLARAQTSDTSEGHKPKYENTEILIINLNKEEV